MRALPAVTTFSILLAAMTQLAQSTPVQLEENAAEEDALEERSCSNPCGYYDQLCCTSSQTCTTNSLGQAECVDGSSSGSGTWQYYTTTYTQTDLATITSVYSSYITAAPTATATCAVSLGESVCGASCCSAEETCDNGVCVAGTSTEEAATATAPAAHPTSSGAETTTATASATTTVSFIAPVATNGSTIVSQASGGGGLSGGAIAGIVIGVVAGVFLLILLCACLCIGGAIDGLLALLGLKPRKRKETTYVEEHVSHHSHGAEPARRTWFGTRPSRPVDGEKSSGFGWLAWLAVMVGAIALCLGLRRRQREDEKSEYSYGPGSSYYYYSDYYYPSESSASSDDRRTRRTRDSRSDRRSRR